MIGPCISTPSSTNLLTILLTDSGDIASGGCTPGGSISGSFNHSCTQHIVTNPVDRAIEWPSSIP